MQHTQEYIITETPDELFVESDNIKFKISLTKLKEELTDLLSKAYIKAVIVKLKTSLGEQAKLAIELFLLFRAFITSTNIDFFNVPSQLLALYFKYFVKALFYKQQLLIFLNFENLQTIASKTDKDAQKVLLVSRMIHDEIIKKNYNISIGNIKSALSLLP